MIKIEELIEQTRQGNKDAYAQLLKSIEGYLINFARTKISNEEDLKEIVQITLIKAYFGIPKLENNKVFKTWITTIFLNECKRFYIKKKNHKKIIEKCKLHNFEEVSKVSLDDNLNFNNIIKCLNEKEQNIFKLYYEDGLTIKQISKYLDINQNTIKTILKRGKDKIKKTHKISPLFVFILCIIITTGVIAISIISHIIQQFELNSVGIENSGIVSAIEHKEWFQETNMDYIDLNDGYKIKVDYLLMDEMNLYMVFDLVSEKDISKFSDISFPDLKIVDENGNIICDKSNVFANQYHNKMGYKSIDNTDHNIKSLLYIYTDSFPNSKTLNISFSKVSLAKKLKNKDVIDANINIKIDLSDKFINRQYTTYESNDNEIPKAIITETGFYSIIEIDNDININNIRLIDDNNSSYDCYFDKLNNPDTTSKIKYIVISDFNKTENKKLQLLINDKTYDLKKQ